jgi:hypothetical protein
MWNKSNKCTVYRAAHIGDDEETRLFRTNTKRCRNEPFKITTIWNVETCLVRTARYNGDGCDVVPGKHSACPRDMVNVSKGGWAHFNLTFWYGGGSHTLSSLITPLPKLFSTPFGCYATTPRRKQPAMRPPSLVVPEPQRPVVRLTQHVSSRWQTHWLQPNATRAEHSGCGGRVTNLPVFFRTVLTLSFCTE